MSRNPPLISPFLISRSRSNDYRVILVPGFLAESGKSELLLDATAIGECASQTFFRRTVSSPKAGHFTVVYQIRPAVPQDLGDPDTEALTDRQGRTILFISGLVIENVQAENELRLSETDISQFNHEIVDAYKRLWQGETTVSIASRRPLKPTTAADRLLKITAIDPIEFSIEPVGPIHSSNPTSPTPQQWIWILIIGSLLSFLFFLLSLKPTDKAKAGWQKWVDSLQNAIEKDVFR